MLNDVEPRGGVFNLANHAKGALLCKGHQFRHALRVTRGPGVLLHAHALKDVIDLAAFNLHFRKRLPIGAEAEAMDRAGLGLLPVDAACFQLVADLVGNFFVEGENGDVAVGQLDGLNQGGGFASAGDGFENARAGPGCHPVEEIGLLGGRGECLGHFSVSICPASGAPVWGDALMGEFNSCVNGFTQKKSRKVSPAAFLRKDKPLSFLRTAGRHPNRP